jgi:hypothetical protein
MQLYIGTAIYKKLKVRGGHYCAMTEGYVQGHNNKYRQYTRHCNESIRRL